MRVAPLALLLVCLGLAAGLRPALAAEASGPSPASRRWNELTDAFIEESSARTPRA